MCLASKDPRPSGPRTPDPLGQVHYRPLPIGVPLQKETSPSLPSHPLFLEVSGTLELSPVPGPHPGGHRNTQSLTHATRSILPVLLGLNLRSSLCRASAFPNKKYEIASALPVLHCQGSRSAWDILCFSG